MNRTLSNKIKSLSKDDVIDMLSTIAITNVKDILPIVIGQNVKMLEKIPDEFQRAIKEVSLDKEGCIRNVKLYDAIDAMKTVASLRGWVREEVKIDGKLGCVMLPQEYDATVEME